MFPYNNSNNIRTGGINTEGISTRCSSCFTVAVLKTRSINLVEGLFEHQQTFFQWYVCEQDIPMFRFITFHNKYILIFLTFLVVVTIAPSLLSWRCSYSTIPLMAWCLSLIQYPLTRIRLSLWFFVFCRFCRFAGTVLPFWWNYIVLNKKMETWRSVNIITALFDSESNFVLFKILIFLWVFFDKLLGVNLGCWVLMNESFGSCREGGIHPHWRTTPNPETACLFVELIN